MRETATPQSFQTIHFPQRTKLIKNLRYVSFLVNDIVLLGSLIVLFAWITNISSIKNVLFGQLAIIPSSSILFILIGIPLFFGAKRHITHGDDASDQYPWWDTWIPISSAFSACLLGLLNILTIPMLHMFSLLTVPPMVGLCFSLIGLSLIPPFTRIPHRFHITQLFIFIISGVSMYVVLQNIFQLLTTTSLQLTTFLPFSLALTFVFFCFGILLRWSNRGFFGNFTLDSTGSRFAFRILLINLLLTPLLAISILLWFHHVSSILPAILSSVVVLFAFISSLLIWMNVKLLYSYELEHLLMRESLRAHNIDLTKEEATLRQKMTEIEHEKQDYADKLATQTAWRDAADAVE